MALGFIGLQMYRSDEYTMETQYVYMKYMNARNLARASVHAALRTYDRNLTPPTGVSTSFNAGTFRLDSLWSSTNLDTLRMVTRGTYAESTYVMRLTLFRSTRPFPTVGAALGIRATPLTKFTMNGKPLVDGRAYDTSGTRRLNPGEEGYGDKPGIAAMNAADTTKINGGQGNGTINGTPPMTIDTTTVDPRPFLDIYKNNADFTFIVRDST